MADHPGIPVLSLYQPYASAMVVGDPPIKGVETRSWAPPKSMIGTRIGIHSAKNPAAIAAIESAASGAVVDINARAMMQDVVAEDLVEFPFGVILGTATLAGVYRTENIHVLESLLPGRVVPDGDTLYISTREARWGDYSPDRYGWLYADVEPLPEPVPFHGGQRLTRRWTP